MPDEMLDSDDPVAHLVCYRLNMREF